MKLTGIHLPGFKLDKEGRLVRSAKPFDVSTRLKQRGSKRVRVVPRRLASDGLGRWRP